MWFYIILCGVLLIALAIAKKSRKSAPAVTNKNAAKNMLKIQQKTFKISKVKGKEYYRTDNEYIDNKQEIVFHTFDEPPHYRISYISSNGQESDREIYPLIVTGDKDGCPHYIVAYCPRHKDSRTFKITRIERATDLSSGEIFEDLDALLTNLIGQGETKNHP